MDREYVETITRDAGWEKRVKVVNDLFDDIESRTCINCKYLTTIKGSMFCENLNSSAKFVCDDFGCNQFQRLEK